MKLLATFSLALLATLKIHAQGLIWSANNWADNTIAAPGGSWQIAFDHTSGDVEYPPSQNPSTRIFTMSLFTNDTGRTFFANTLNESGFTGFVAGLTDGINGNIRFQDGGLGWLGGGGSERLFLGRSSASPDLAGYNITQIGFRVNNFYDYYDFWEDRYFRTLEYSLDFYGAPVSLPGLKIRRSAADVILLWPSSFSDFTLQHTSALATTNWSNVVGSVQDDGTNRTVTVSAPAGIQFYRLFKP